MALQILPRQSAAKADSNAKTLLHHLAESEGRLHLEDAIIFYNFPLFREDDRLLVADVVLISPRHGVVLISTLSSSLKDSEQRLEGAFSQIFSRLVRYPRLRAGRAQLAVGLEAFVWTLEGRADEGVKVGLPALDEALNGILGQELPPAVFQELISVMDGSKALLKPKERGVENYSPTSRIAVVARLEEEIRRFDRDQRVAYMTEVEGLQRIIGLAGSGKTVVLALKAALTAVREPDAKIAITFYTKSLYQHIKQLITRFYRMHEDRDPDWRNIQVLHAWGGATLDGFYYQTARRFGHIPLNFSQASNLSRDKPFAAVCARLLDDPSVRGSFDYVFIDEAQDFPPEFMKLALRLAVDEKLVIAYDVFQTIFDVDTPTAASLFGTTDSEVKDVVFDEEIVLHKCYRNPREILVCAHAIGFGIYGKKIVQMLESKEHWVDFGYEALTDLTPGQEVVVTRPEENSPSSISDSNSIDEIIKVATFDRPGEEVDHVAKCIVREIQEEGMSPEDILVICADDRNAAVYLQALERILNSAEVRTNNYHTQRYGLRDFYEDGAVTLSTVYKAKGNEAYSVYLVGIDALFYAPSPRSRNRAFTGMTRAKGWICVTGVGDSAKMFANELSFAKKKFPNLEFKFPTESELVFMKRDLVMVDPDLIDADIDTLGEGLALEDFERMLRKKLREVQGRRRSKKRIQ